MAANMVITTTAAKKTAPGLGFDGGQRPEIDQCHQDGHHVDVHHRPAADSPR